MLSWNFGFRMWRLTRALGVLLLGPACVWGLSKKMSDVTVASSQYDLLLCSDTLVSDRLHISEFLVPGFGCPGMECHGPVGWLHMCELYTGHLAYLNLSVAVVRCWYSGCVVLDRTSTCSVCIATLT